MKHLADEFDAGWLIGVLLLEVHDKSESAIFKRCIRRSDNDGVPFEGKIIRVSIFGLSVLGVWRKGDKYHVMTLSAIGEADTPAGGSVCIRCDGDTGSALSFKTRHRSYADIP